MPCYDPNWPLKLLVVDTLLAGEMAAVDVGDYHYVGPAPTVENGMALRALTDEEQKRLTEEGML
jgi:hypothetical protein